MSRAAIAILVAVVLAAALPARGLVAAPLSDKARARLMAYVGSYDCDAFLADSVIHARLSALLGRELEHLMTNIDVKAEIGFESGMVTIEGNAPHRGGEEHGFIGVSTYDGSVCAALLTGGKLVVYATPSDYFALPFPLREWVLATWAYVTLDGQPPPTLVLH